MPSELHRTPVQTVYSQEKVISDIVSLHNGRGAEKGLSLRQIARQYNAQPGGRKITHADIGRVLKGRFPVNVEKRLRLHGPPVCPKCYQKMPRPPRQIQPWVLEAMANLQRLETAANVTPDEHRFYSHGGKRAVYAPISQ